MLSFIDVVDVQLVLLLLNDENRDIDKNPYVFCGIKQKVCLFFDLFL